MEQATEAEGAGARAWLARLGVPVLQALIGTDGRAAWSARAAGLRPLDVAMQVALPEFDGRLTTVPVAFKESDSGHEGRCTFLTRSAAPRSPARQPRGPCCAGRRAQRSAGSPSSWATPPAATGASATAWAWTPPASLHALLLALRGAGLASPTSPLRATP